MVFNAVAALFAMLMLTRHGPRAVSALRGSRGEDRPRSLVPLLNVAIAIAVLVVAVKGLARALITR